jgi:hypothetical protein
MLNQTQPNYINRNVLRSAEVTIDCDGNTKTVEYQTDEVIIAPHEPMYNKNALVNILIDHDPATDTVVPGSRKGIMPALLGSKYSNVNYLAPVKKGIESAVKSMVRSYLNSFTMTKGPVNNADLVRFWENNQRNPKIDWDIPIYRLMYFADNESLDQLERSLSLVRDLSRDARFVEFIKKALPALDDYLYAKWLEENWSLDSPTARPSREEAKSAGLFQIGLTESEIDDILGFIRDLVARASRSSTGVTS